jgi:hypothetical protein
MLLYSNKIIFLCFVISSLRQTRLLVYLLSFSSRNKISIEKQIQQPILSLSHRIVIDLESVSVWCKYPLNPFPTHIQPTTKVDIYIFVFSFHFSTRFSPRETE